MTHVNSNDPRKPEIVRLLKATTGATKVTELREGPRGTFTGRCLKHENGRYTVLGEHSVQLADAGKTCRHCHAKIVQMRPAADAPLNWWHDTGAGSSPRYFQYCQGQNDNSAEPGPANA